MREGAGSGDMAGSTNTDKADSFPGDRECHWLLICLERRDFKNSMWVSLSPKMLQRRMARFDLLPIRCTETSFYLLEWESQGQDSIFI